MKLTMSLSEYHSLRATIREQGYNPYDTLAEMLSYSYVWDRAA